MAGPMTVSAADATTSAGTADLDALFPSFADGHTAGLWLFDEPQYLNMTLTDAGREMYDLRLLAGGRLEPGRFGNALKCSAQSGPAGRPSWLSPIGVLSGARPLLQLKLILDRQLPDRLKKTLISMTVQNTVTSIFFQQQVPSRTL
jgi:hypothetical protein